jgi:hypothetical protein
LPVAAGDHMFFWAPIGALPAAPCTISIAMKRSFLPAAAAPWAKTARAGTIASSSGSAMVTPTPLSTARREMFLLVINIRSPLPL